MKDSSFLQRNFVRWVWGSPKNEGVKEVYGIPLKSDYFIANGSYSVKMVADKYRYVAHHNEHQWRAF